MKKISIKFLIVLLTLCVNFSSCGNSSKQEKDELVNENSISTPEQDAKELMILYKRGDDQKLRMVLEKKTNLYLTQRGVDETHRFHDIVLEEIDDMVDKAMKERFE